MTNWGSCDGCMYKNEGSKCTTGEIDCEDYQEYKPKYVLDKKTGIYIDASQRVVGIDGGLKNDLGKPRWSLVPLDIIEGIAVILTYGAKKYAPNNWKKVEWERNFDALLRHLTKWLAGEENDQDSGLHHLDHALCDLMFIRWWNKHKKVID